jgi:hypothetical protein
MYSMNAGSKRPLGLSLAALTLLALSACGPGTPPVGSSSPTPSTIPSATAISTPTPTPTVTPAPEREAETVILTALTVVVLGDDGSTLADVAFATTTAADAVAALTDVLGAPTTSTVAEAYCVAATTKYDWGGLILTDPAAVTAAYGSLFSVLFTGSATTDGVGLQGPFAVAVGMTKAAVLAAAPGTTFNDRGSGFGTIALDAGDASPAENAWGTVAYLNSGIVSGIDSPVYHFGEC